jgi:hypothetical protein
MQTNINKINTTEQNRYGLFSSPHFPKHEKSHSPRLNLHESAHLKRAFGMNTPELPSRKGSSCNGSKHPKIRLSIGAL